jgi:uncharacterized membrane protein
MTMPDAVQSPGVAPAERERMSAGGVARPRESRAVRSVTGTVRAWFAVAVIGQLLFAVYIGAFYGATAAAGDLTMWNKVMPRGYRPGDLVGNSIIAIHLLLALVINLTGALQFIPQLRARVPRVHRWTGRVFVSAAFVMSIGGLYMAWIRGTVGDAVQHWGSTLNAVAILISAACALSLARAREFASHRRWALRLFLATSGVWFYRLGLMTWLLFWRAPVGFDMHTFTGPFLNALTFGETLVPLAMLEWYLWARSPRASARGQFVFAGGMMIATLLTCVGIFGATLGLWLPKLKLLL